MIPADYLALAALRGHPVVFAAHTQSTNDDAKRGAREDAASGTIWLADEQAAGRGRQGRTWSSPPGDNVLLSVLVRGTFSPKRLPLAALVTGLAVRDAVARAVAPAVRLKWPNDVLVLGRKISGILVEAQPGSLVLGIGLNVHTREFPPDLNATSVAALGGTADRAQLVTDVLAYLDEHLEPALHHGLGPLADELARHDALLGQRVQSDAGAGLAEGIDAEGRLVVRRDDGEIHAWSSGEVHLAKDPAC